MPAPAAAPSPLAQALGRIPCGLFLVTTKDSGGEPAGFVGSFLQQVGFDPPTIAVAIGQGRPHLDLVRHSGGFAVSVLDADSQRLMNAFFKKTDDGSTPFDGVRTKDAGHGLVFLDSLAWLDCEFSGEHTAGDHVVVFGRVRAGETFHPGDPSIHLRKNGLGY